VGDLIARRTSTDPDRHGRQRCSGVEARCSLAISAIAAAGSRAPMRVRQRAADDGNTTDVTLQQVRRRPVRAQVGACPKSDEIEKQHGEARFAFEYWKVADVIPPPRQFVRPRAA